MAAKTKTKPKAERKPRQATIAPPAAQAPPPKPAGDIRVTPITKYPRARILRVTITELWGSGYINGAGKTFRIYPQREKETAETVGHVHNYILTRVAAVQKELANENQHP